MTNKEPQLQLKMKTKIDIMILVIWIFLTATIFTSLNLRDVFGVGAYTIYTMMMIIMAAQRGYSEILKDNGKDHKLKNG